MRGIAVAGIHIDDRQREIARRNDVRIVVLAGAAGADEAVLRPLVAVDLGVLEGGPVRLLVLEAADVFFHDVFERNTFEFFRARMTGDGHGLLLNVRVEPESIPSTGRCHAPRRRITCARPAPAATPATATAADRAARRREMTTRRRPHWRSRRRPR